MQGGIRCHKVCPMTFLWCTWQKQDLHGKLKSPIMESSLPEAQRVVLSSPRMLLVSILHYLSHVLLAQFVANYLFSYLTISYKAMFLKGFTQIYSYIQKVCRHFKMELSALNRNHFTVITSSQLINSPSLLSQPKLFVISVVPTDFLSLV